MALAACNGDLSFTDRRLFFANDFPLGVFWFSRVIRRWLVSYSAWFAFFHFRPVCGTYIYEVVYRFKRIIWVLGIR